MSKRRAIDGLESLEQPAFVNEHALDRGVPLECRHGIVENLGRRALKIPRRVEPELVGLLVTVEAELADDDVLVAGDVDPR